MRFAVLASGYGSNLQAIIKAVKQGKIKATLGLVISDNKNAFALKRAKKAGIKAVFINPKQYHKREDFDREMVKHLRQEQIDFVVMAGFMRILSPYFIRTYKNKILNIHPALLPAFKGAHAIKDAFFYGVKVTGVSVHFADEKVDHGPIILQEPVRITDRDTLASVEEKIHKVEHKLYPKAIELFVKGKLNIKRRVVKGI